MCDSRLVREARFLPGVGIREDEHPFMSLGGSAPALPSRLSFFFFSTVNIETVASSSFLRGEEAVLHGIWDLSSLTRDQTQTPCSGSLES